MAIENFASRHIGPRNHEIDEMLATVGVSSIDELIDQTVPRSIRLESEMKISEGISEYEYFNKIREIAQKNKIFKTYIGMGYYNTITPAVIQRNILENPSWYTSYTPYQAEISQGRLEALLNFQTMVMELTGMEMANASLLDEATAAAEAMIMMLNSRPRKKAKAGANILFVDENMFPQTIEVIKTRALPLGIELKIGNWGEHEFNDSFFGAIVQYPAGDGSISDYSSFADKAKEKEIFLTVAADLLSLSLLTPPGEWGADIVVGSTQRFGVPMGYGGPHAAYFAAHEKFKRNLPGRIIGVSKDRTGRNALRMALQVREQHIKRERATSNICTAQALLASMAGMYAVYHGKDGLQKIAKRIHGFAGFLSTEIEKMGYVQENENFFDTLKIKLPGHLKACNIQSIALEFEINLRYISERSIGISIDETTSKSDIANIIEIFALANNKFFQAPDCIDIKNYVDDLFLRTSNFLSHSLFNMYRSETEMMRYIKKLERRDFSLTHSMISLGSCTMKLNAAVEMLPISWPEFGALHPFIPRIQAKGYHEIFADLEKDLAEITGFSGVSLQPNSGAAGEYAGLLVIKKYHEEKQQGHRNVILIPSSAHGTNPASAVMAGGKIIVIDCDENGNIAIDDLRKKAEEHKENLMAFMVTYPSTHGVFEANIMEMCEIIHTNGGLVYMDGANMNAQVGLTNPGSIGADVCHLNLHKTFGIPHGGGGPGVGPICVAKPLVGFLPSHPVVNTGGSDAVSAIAAAPYGSASVMVITHAYIKLLGNKGLNQVTEMAILNANYLASELKDYFKILYTGTTGRVAHEMILECRNFKSIGQITESDIAKRLMDYGFHAPTLSFPVHGTLMVEPTESES
ncbi:MAG: aminomethyl-transferring glycine dehydrogenase, partial [Bacteroidota bacterium]|nr:aminomethyl-transferring glycine dehydrogenase [Bacteroidota bacterium]